jgi:hypothetical protein
MCVGSGECRDFRALPFFTAKATAVAFAVRFSLSNRSTIAARASDDGHAVRAVRVRISRSGWKICTTHLVDLLRANNPGGHHGRSVGRVESLERGRHEPLNPSGRREAPCFEARGGGFSTARGEGEARRRNRSGGTSVVRARGRGAGVRAQCITEVDPVGRIDASEYFLCHCAYAASILRLAVPAILHQNYTFHRATGPGVGA